jgi:glycerate-2-kinase
MFINRNELLDNASNRTFYNLRKDALDILEVAVKAVDPYNSVIQSLNINGTNIALGNFTWDLNDFQEIYVIGGGKACGAMAHAIEDLFGDRITGGVINILKGTESLYKLKRISLIGASHPIPDEDGVKGVKLMMSLLDNLESSVLIIVLISGGGSSLLTIPAEDVDLQDIKKVTNRLLMSGATIDEINTVRKHLSCIKGGLLAKKAYPATIISLILSDVVGDSLDTIASGPTAPDKTTYYGAKKILEKYCIWDNIPVSVKTHLEKGVLEEISETPKEGDPVFKKVTNYLIGSNIIASKAAVKRARTLGYHSELVSTKIVGEARNVGISFAKLAKTLANGEYTVKPPAALVLGGETTVTVIGNGIGGRNMEVALAASVDVRESNILIATLATDGIDGPTESAGAIVDGDTLQRAHKLNLNPFKYLKNNDSYNFFRCLGDAIITGPTGTNVNDISIILVNDFEE